MVAEIIVTSILSFYLNQIHLRFQTFLCCDLLKYGRLNGRMVFMNAIVEIDKAGRIVVPKKLRDDLHLVPGTRLRIERSGDRLVFEQAFSEPQLILKDGMWVVSGSQTTEVDISDVIRQGYAEREARILEGSGLV
jgi:AbrB family looped-hinge helix DNA binding protein